MWPSGMKDRNLFVVVGEKRDIVKKKEKSLSKETKVTDTGKSFVSLHRSLGRAGVNLISKPNCVAGAFVSNSAGMSVWFEQFFRGSWWGEV